MICPPLKQGNAEGRREGKSQRIVKCESGCRGGAGYRDRGSQAMQRFKSEKENFEFNTVSHRKPVKIMQNWGDMCRTLGVVCVIWNGVTWEYKANARALSLTNDRASVSRPRL